MISQHGDGKIQHCQGCHFQFAIDFSFTLVQFKWFMCWRDRNIKLIFMSQSYRCDLGQVLTLAKQKTYCTLSLGPQRLTSSAGCIYNMQNFDFEAALTEGYFWSIAWALYHEESKHCLSIHLPCLSLTFSQPRACIDSPFPFFFFFLHPMLSLKPPPRLSHIHTVRSYRPGSTKADPSWLNVFFMLLCSCVFVLGKWGHSCRLFLGFQTGPLHGRQWVLEKGNRGGMRSRETQRMQEGYKVIKE